SERVDREIHFAEECGASRFICQLMPREVRLLKIGARICQRVNEDENDEREQVRRTHDVRDAVANISSDWFFGCRSFSVLAILRWEKTDALRRDFEHRR